MEYTNLEVRELAIYLRESLLNDRGVNSILSLERMILTHIVGADVEIEREYYRGWSAGGYLQLVFTMDRLSEVGCFSTL
jgi:poly(3-hydroxybutyrate) depolymerase